MAAIRIYLVERKYVQSILHDRMILTYKTKTPLENINIAIYYGPRKYRKNITIFTRKLENSLI